MSQPESKLSRDIMNALRARGVFCFKIHGGPTMMSGLPDIVACVPIIQDDGFARGMFVGLETKMPGNRPSVRQDVVHQQIRNAFGVVAVVRSVSDALQALESAGWVPTTPDA
jgi:hypothetical protein